MSPDAFKVWFGQATTGAGIAGILGTLSAVAAGQLTLQHAAPLLVAGVVGLVWPENKAVQQQASTFTQDLIGLVPLIAAAIEHGKTTAMPPEPATSVVQTSGPAHAADPPHA